MFNIHSKTNLQAGRFDYVYTIRITRFHVSLFLSDVPKCGSSRWGCSWYPFIIAVGGNGQCYKAETVHPVITNTLIGGWCSLRMTVLPKNLSMLRSLVNASLWTSGRLEMSAFVSSVSLNPPNRDSFPVIPGSPCSPFSASGKAILLDFSVSQLQRLTVASQCSWIQVMALLACY